jgi:hypothetical protein
MPTPNPYESPKEPGTRMQMTLPRRFIYWVSSHGLLLAVLPWFILLALLGLKLWLEFN